MVDHRWVLATSLHDVPWSTRQYPQAAEVTFPHLFAPWALSRDSTSLAPAYTAGMAPSMPDDDRSEEPPADADRVTRRALRSSRQMGRKG